MNVFQRPPTGLEPEDQRTPLTTDPWIYRMVVGALSLTIIACVAGSIWLHVNDKNSPDLLTGLGTGCFGALAGLLVPPPAKT